MALGGQEHLNVLGGGIEALGELGRGHDGRLIFRERRGKISIGWRIVVRMKVLKLIS